MKRRALKVLILMALAAFTQSGCRPVQPFYFLDDGDRSHLLDQATKIEYPDTETTSLAEVENACAPLTLSNATPQQIWELHLEECVKITMSNSKVMRQLGARFSSLSFNPRPQVNDPSDVLSSNPNASSTVYDPAIVESTPFVGVESALAAFDPTLTSSLGYVNNDHAQNVGGIVNNPFVVGSLVEDQATFQSALTKVTASGGTLAMRHNVIYDNSNLTTRNPQKDWTVNQEFAFSQPLLQGAGVQFNRIAGPNNPFTGVGTAGFDGVMLARINTDITLVQFEEGMRNLVADVENAYWELSFAYRALGAAKTGRTAALESWRTVHAKYEEGAEGGGGEKEAQAKENYFLFKSQVQQAFNDLLRAERRLRFVMGLAVADGRLIRPADEPTTAKVHFDWNEIHCEALARSPELRQQKWRIKINELSLIAAKNFLLPRLDVGGTYRFFGLGDELIDPSRGPGINSTSTNIPGTNAYGVLTNGQFQEWNLQAQFSMPLGFRKELSQVRHYELQVARDRARLQDQELEVSHQVGDAYGNIEVTYAQAQTNFNRAIAAKNNVDAVTTAYDAGRISFDQVLDAQRRRADAEVAYYRSLADYNRAIMIIHLRKGSLLEYDGVYLTEGPWPCKAYFDADRLAKQRDASLYLNYGYTRPRVVSQGPYQQFAGGETGGDTMLPAEEGTPVEAMPNAQPVPEAIPAPQPQSQPTPAEGTPHSAGRARRNSVSLPSGTDRVSTTARTTATTNSRTDAYGRTASRFDDSAGPSYR
jgi:outer membrane protein TolC